MYILLRIKHFGERNYTFRDILTEVPVKEIFKKLTIETEYKKCQQ
jgi:hypothetical protein